MPRPSIARRRRRLGLIDQLERTGVEPTELIYRDGLSGDRLAAHAVRKGGAYRDRFGAPYLGIHRADLQTTLGRAVGAEHIHLAHRLERNLAPLAVVVLLAASFILVAPHLTARPHVLAMPVMVAWVAGLVAAADRRAAPSLWLLPLLALWANIHGSFLLGLVLVGPIGLDALWNAQAPRRKILAFKWALFGIGALTAICATPYGWDTLAMPQMFGSQVASAD